MRAAPASSWPSPSHGSARSSRRRGAIDTWVPLGGPSPPVAKELAMPALDAVSPDNARSLRAFFARHTRESTMALLARSPVDTPGVNVEMMMKRITAPWLIVTTRQDYTHPLAYGDRLHALLPNAALRIVTSKTIDGDRYVAEFRDV